MNFSLVSLKSTQTIRRILRQIRRDAELRSGVFQALVRKPSLQNRVFSHLAKDLDLQSEIIAELAKTPKFRRKMLKGRPAHRKD